MKTAFPIKTHHSIHHIDSTEWDNLDHKSPFTSYAFLSALEQSGATSFENGWRPHIIAVYDGAQKLQAALIGHIKYHSYGEYIFDWNIAQAYEQAGHQYYPKFCSSIPFTPVNTNKLLFKPGVAQAELFPLIIMQLESDIQLSSFHHLFLSADTVTTLKTHHYIPRASIQYHWTNPGYHHFDHFLLDCTSSKRKMIRKEREKVSASGLKIMTIEPEDMIQYAQLVYTLYLETIRKKGSIAYLNHLFFQTIFRSLKKDIHLEIAFEDSSPIAFSLFFKSPSALYGRYWGIQNEKEESYPFLHFEMCYYRGIDFCINQQIPLFEAGAQGIHKISRGFKPVEISSAHKFTDKRWHDLVSTYMHQEMHDMKQIIIDHSKLLPYRLGRE